MSRRCWSAIPVLTLCLAFGVGTTSCGGGGGGTNPDLALLGFNQPNVAGVALNQPLIFTFSADIDPLSITPDTLRIVGAFGPFFELTHVDGNLVALLPRAPNFGNLSDVGLAPNTPYSVSMPTFPAVDTIESTGGKPLLSALTYNFRTVSGAPYFIESRRALEHGTPPSSGGRSDDLGCLQNPTNALYVNPCDLSGGCFEPTGASADALPQQTNSVPGGQLLCLQNEGQPRVVRERCVPLHDQRAVGTPAAGSNNIGRVSLPAIEMFFNEQIDPSTAVPYNTATKLASNVQLWRVALLDGTPLLPPEPIQTNEPLVSQSLASTEVLLVASGPVLQGIYMVNLTGNIRDLAQNTLFTSDRPSLVGQVYAGLDAGLGPTVPPGWRQYFQTLQIAGAASAINESFGANLAEHGDINSGLTEPGVFTQSVTTTNPLSPMAGVIPGGMTTQAFTLLFGPNPGTALQCGQTTTANWNGGFRFMNLASLEANVDADNGAGRLKAVWKPYLGGAGDGVFDSDAGLFNPGPGDSVTLSTTPGPGASANGDGIYEYDSFFLHAGDTLTVTGARPLLILCRGAFQVDGLIELSGQDGRFGIDTDGTSDYTNSGSITPWGVGGASGPGGGAGGRGAGPIVSASAVAGSGSTTNDIFGAHAGPAGGGGGPGGAGNAVGGGGGGGFVANGTQGTRLDTSGASNSGAFFGTALFERTLLQFTPDRGYSPNADISGGTGGGAGGALLLIGEGGVLLQPGATLSAAGGAGGTSGTVGYSGGAGSDGRITLMDVGGPAVSTTGALLTPAASTFTWRPTVQNASVGQSQWIDLFTPTVNFNPVIGVPQVPFDTDNFSVLITAGQVRGPAAGFDAVWEFQGADSLTPLPSAGTPSAATGLTQWSTNIDLCDGKRYFRYRWRFQVSSAFPATGPSALPMPAVLDCTIPFVK